MVSDEKMRKQALSSFSSSKETVGCIRVMAAQARMNLRKSLKFQLELGEAIPVTELFYDK